jgi:predicted ATPase/class 3 adenylate cyclase
VPQERSTAGVDPVGPGAALTGTVTFLFTDIEGSTRLLREAGPAYPALLEDHRELLRTTFFAHGGREVDTQGDSFFVAFPNAGQAVAAATEAQLGFAAHRWPPGLDVRVRMGLHSGEVTAVGRSYVGLAVHRAARVAALAHGGQVLLSEATASLVRDDLPERTSLRSLGDHRLKDFPRPAPLFQLDVAGLPTDFPPLRTALRPHHLPVPSGALLGRDDDVATVTALLRDPRTRLVTLTGPGGIGKTRLALAVADAVAPDFPGGAFFVPLGAVADPALVLSTIADAVGARREAGSDVQAAVRVTLGDERTLLVLDNFEQVAQAAGELAALLDDLPSAVVLVTSRQVLRLRSERQYPVSPLSNSPAVQLFAERAAAVRPGFSLTAGNRAAVAEICRRLDGLPLAIELAAARVRLLPPDALLGRLRERLDVLGGGPVDLPERQRTLRATMDWSHDLLRPHEQALFGRLAVFSGGWTIPAAEVVCGRAGEPDVLDTLALLLDDSLLVTVDDPVPEPRLSMLETVRAYAEEKLAASPDRDETERRHTRWLLALTEEFVHTKGTDLRAYGERFEPERPNLRAGVQRAIDAGDLDSAAQLLRNTFGPLRQRSAEREAVGWLQQILPRAAELSGPQRGRLLVHAALVESLFGDLAAVRPLLDGALRLLPDEPDFEFDRAVAAAAGFGPAVAEGSLDAALRSVAEADARFAAIGQQLGRAWMAVAAGDLLLGAGDLDAAIGHYDSAVELAAELDDDALAGQAQSTRGLALLAKGDADAARQSVLDGARYNRRGGQPTSIAYSLEGLAAIALVQGRASAAARALGAASAARRSIAAPLTPPLRPLADRFAAQAEEQLGKAGQAAAWAEGEGLSPLEALDKTLDALEAVSSD